MIVATLKNYTISTTDVDSSQLYFEHNRLGDESSGGMWFEGKELVDYDGVFALPKSVVEYLTSVGYNMEYAGLELDSDEIPHSA